MGTVLAARCKCGYKDSLIVGSSMAQHGNVFNFPHRCLGCSNVASLNVLEKRKACPRCGCVKLLPYSATTKALSESSVLNVLSPGLLLRLGFHRRSDVLCDFYVHGLRRTLAILDEPQYCPKCNSYSLNFSINFSFD